ncbi:MAG: leucyl aminopeptidase [Hyphomonadaceae bacterium]|nr:leucyl aminopeptidase [Hyphomonadaceae bacterium]
MDIRFATEATGDSAVLMACEGPTLLDAGKALDEKAQGAVTRAMAAARFNGGAGQVVEILAPGGLDFSRVLVIGLGNLERADALACERWGAQATRRTIASGAQQLALLIDALPNAGAADAAARAAIGARLGSYRFDSYRTRLKPEQRPSLKEIHVVVQGPAAAKSRYEKDSSVADAVYFARDLVSEPANVLYPEEFAKRLKKLESLGLEVTILGEKEMADLGMNAILGVGKGSVRETQLVVMNWKGARTKGAQPIALVGKGVTFDTGGISIKPAGGMDEMKGDMGGAAAVAGAMMAIAARKAKANVVGIVGLVENMPDGEAQRPGDIVTSASGQTIEVLNTDAEGRLVLADALWYAQEKHNPAAIVDLATLTGAVIVALGNEYAGLYSNDDDFAASVQAAGTHEGELVWRMPLAPAYDKMIDSPNADMKNIAGKPVAGSVIGAQFLKRFIKEGTPWAHLDIAGTAWKSAPGEDPVSPAWATGWGVRVLNRLVAQKFED